jgi:hypothetical protein
MAHHNIDRTVKSFVQKQQAWQLWNKGSVNYRTCIWTLSLELSEEDVEGAYRMSRIRPSSSAPDTHWQLEVLH